MKSLLAQTAALPATLLSLLLIPLSNVNAQVPLPPSPTGAKFTAAGLPAQIISAFLGPITIILGFLTVFYIIFAGIRLIISRGDPEKVAEARHRLIYAVVGFIVLLLSYVALQVVNQLFLGSGVV